ncbi:hypothetical protein [Bartonella sp. AA1HLJMS]|uniref:hypothetical protein n=1 Tax=Bartonella sp. AA1HLJMS TaxID=3243424 RepID=UPI0035D06A94
MKGGGSWDEEVGVLRREGVGGEEFMKGGGSWDEEAGVLRREGVGKVVFEVGLTGALRDLTLGW